MRSIERGSGGVSCEKYRTGAVLGYRVRSIGQGQWWGMVWEV